MSKGETYVFITEDGPSAIGYEYVTEYPDEYIHNYKHFNNVPDNCKTNNWYQYVDGKYKKVTRKSKIALLECEL